MKHYFEKSTSAAPLAVFRIVLGVMLFLGTVRFWNNGWIESLYIQPRYFFPFYGFEFVVPLGNYTYLLFVICGLSALFVAFGLFYRVSITLLFLSFTYIELIDKTTYLNHYYFISMVCLLMIFLPAHVYFSVDAYRNKSIAADLIPQWTIDTVKAFVFILYFFAGIAKINSDWLLHALPLKIWLPARNDMPLIGFLFNYRWVHFLFSWVGCIYDVTIPFFLWNSRTRPWAFLAVVIFHVLTSLLFPIGMFPYVMIGTALIFFSGKFHQNLIEKLSGFLRISRESLSGVSYTYSKAGFRFIRTFLVLFFLIQLILPFRYLFYPGKLFWTEQGYRFSWRVMLMEKAGYAQFTIKDDRGKQFVVNNNDFLTVQQEKMMSTQPDMMLQYAHILRDYYAAEGYENPRVYVDSYVALNGRRGKTFVDPEVNLAQEKESFRHKSWILLYNE